MERQRQGGERAAQAFREGHDRLNELRAILGIRVPEAAPSPTSETDSPEDSADHEAPVAVEPRGRSIDLSNPADLLLVVLWTATIGLLVAAVLATR